MSGDIPQWAVTRARELASQRGHTDVPCGAIDAFAAFISEHEEAPVDPVLVVAREMFAADHRSGAVDLVWTGVLCKHGGAHGAILKGEFDHRREVQNYLRALRRGIELGKQQ
jgi:hypothetical protein